MSQEYPLVQKEAVYQYEKAAEGDVKLYPSLELVRLEKWFFNSKKGKLLEYAFGSGCNTIHLIKCGYKIYGLDVSSNWVRKTKQRIKKAKCRTEPKLFYMKPLSKKIPFKTNTFDYIVAMSVLSLLGSEKKVKNLLKEFKRVLKPSGKIILDINDQSSVFSGNKNKIAKNIFRAKPVDGLIKTYCLKSGKDFRKLVNRFFKVEDVGFSSHKIFGRKIKEFIICATKN
tara:strand:- start:404 stop:1084 length:681 start_codon:yes stop_codon:yes gene_type:complete